VRRRRWLFDPPETIDYLIGHAGGHPRDLMRLLSFTYLRAENEILTRTGAERAVAHMAQEFRRFLDAEDYALLAEVDGGKQDESSERARGLLRSLALLEYNGETYWWAVHPAIRTLPGFKAAVAARDG